MGRSRPRFGEDPDNCASQFRQVGCTMDLLSSCWGETVKMIVPAVAPGRGPSDRRAHERRGAQVAGPREGANVVGRSGRKRKR